MREPLMSGTGKGTGSPLFLYICLKENTISQFGESAECVKQIMSEFIFLGNSAKDLTSLDILISIACALALVYYWVVVLYTFFKPVKRDRIIVRNFASSILTFVLATPFAITAIIWIVGNAFCEKTIDSKELVWSSDLYPSLYDTIRINKDAIYRDKQGFYTVSLLQQNSDSQTESDKRTFRISLDNILSEDAKNSLLKGDTVSLVSKDAVNDSFLFSKIILDRNICTTNFTELDLMGQAVMEQDSFSFCKILTNDIVSYKDTGSSWEFIVKKDGFPERINHDSPSLFWTVLYHFIDPGNQHMAMSSRGRFITFVISVLGCIIMTGLLITMLISMFERRRERWAKGELRYSVTVKNHVVIIGGEDFITTLVKQIFYYKNPPYILVQTKQNVEKLRTELTSFLPKEYEERTIIYQGDRTSKDDIADLHLEKASEVYILGESEDVSAEEYYHDSLNMKCLNLIASYISVVSHGKKLKCNVMFEHQSTYAMFKFSDVNQEIRDNIIFTPFNIYEMWAQKVLVKNESIEPTYQILKSPREDFFVYNLSGRILHWLRQRMTREVRFNNIRDRRITYKPIDNCGISYSDDKRVHMIIIGMTPMGVAMAFETAQIAHYPNFLRDSKWRTTITFIDSEAFREMNFLKGRYPFLFELSRIREIDSKQYDKSKLYDLDHDGWIDQVKDNEDYSYVKESFLDIQWEFIQGNIESPEIREYLEKAVTDNSAYTTVAVCRQLPYQSIATGIYLPPIVLERALQILIYQHKLPEIVYDLAGMNSNGVLIEQNKFNKIRPFGMTDLAYDERLMDETAPKFVNAFYDDPQFNAEFSATEKSWNSLSIDLKWSNIYFANSIPCKLRSIGLNPDTNPSVMEQEILKEEKELHLSKVEHNRWNMEKLLLNYRALKTNEWKEFDIYREKIKNDQQLSNEELDSLGNLKKKYKKKEFLAHLDLCSYEELRNIDVLAVNYDTDLVRAIPTILRRTAEIDSKRKNVK